jgi:hypothetical protein
MKTISRLIAVTFAVAALTTLASCDSESQPVGLESLPEGAVIEIAIVEIDVARSIEYNAMRREMQSKLVALPGYIAWRSFESTGQPGRMLDVLYWKSREEALSAAKIIQATPEGARFFAMIKKVEMFDHFAPVAL